MKRTLIYNANLIDANIERENSALLIEDGKIAGFPEPKAVKEMMSDSTIEKIDAEGNVVMPSFVDMHAHFRDPGLTQKEDLESGCRAAAAGGFGTVVLMPNTKPVVSSAETAIGNNRKAEEFGLCRVIQTVSITKDFDGKTISHLDEIPAVEGNNPSGVLVISEDGKEVCDSATMLEAMKIAASKNLVVACHCEDPFLADSARPLRAKALEFLAEGKEKEAEELLQKADEILAAAEDCATDRNLRLAKTAGCRIHLCHVSTKHCVESAKRAKADGVNVTFEITPHHISFASGQAPEIFNIVNPPLRAESDRSALVKALKDGTCDCIGTDHAPHTMEDKKNGSPGFSGIETAFASCVTNLVKTEDMTLSQLSRTMSYNPARILGMESQGLLEEGFEANLVIADPDQIWTVRGQDFKSKGKFTPLEGKKVSGRIKMTIFKGKIVYKS